MFAVYCRAEDVCATTVFQFKTLAEFIGREREISYRNVCLADALQRNAQFLFIERADGFDAVLLAGKDFLLLFGEA